MSRDVGGVLREAEKMLDRTGDPRSKTIPRLVGSLNKHVRSARLAHRLEAQGLSPADAATKLGMKPYPAQKLFAQVRNFSAGELDDALVRLADLDHALKGGSRLANELELERALIDITRSARNRLSLTKVRVRGSWALGPALRPWRWGPPQGVPPATSCARRRSCGAHRARRPGRSA